MKRIFLSLLLILFSVVAWPQAPLSKTEIHSKLQSYLTQYPQAQLRDVYKTCFQDFFGPGHLLADTTAAYDYLHSELATTTIFGGPLYEPTGYQGNYYRVNILLVSQGTIPIPLFMNAFIRSANQSHSISVSEWTLLWRDIESVLKSIMPWNESCQADATQIHAMLSKQQYMCHHSPRFNTTYNFHYRIIRKDIFEQELLPLIVSKKI